MLKVIVELHPHGDQTRKKQLAEMIIGNLGRDTDGSGHKYIFRLEEPEPLVGPPVKYEGMVYNYNRNASVWKLIYTALEEAFING